MNLGYHATALRYAHRRWRPFRNDLSAWLVDHVPDPTIWPGILIFGPSGGYCLPRGWLERFPQVTGFEPDPVARWIFRRRFGKKTRVELFEHDVFGLNSPGAPLDSMNRVLEKYPGHLVLFSNLLGQLRFGYPWIVENPEGFAEWKSRFSALFERRSWMSYHDRLSGPARPQMTTHGDEADELGDRELLDRFYSSAPGGELLDHLTAAIFPHGVRRYFHWPLAPRHHHLVEAVARIGIDSLGQS